MKDKGRNIFSRTLRTIFNKHVIVAFLILLQVAAIAYVVIARGMNSFWFYAVCQVSGFIVSVHIIVKRGKSAYKFVWLFTVITLPIFGTLFYILFYRQASSKRFSKRVKNSEEHMREFYSLIGSDVSAATADYPAEESRINYLEKAAGFPVYAGTDAEYLSCGEAMFASMKAELENAKKYIFMEYFIIREGEMWQGIYDILKRKAKEGVKIRIMYDDIGCLKGLPEGFRADLKHHGIECAVFNPFKPFLISVQNNRDHRKITSIDGKIAFTGGVNIADEYINKLNRFGHWKDAGVKLCGKAAWGLTMMFLQNWEMATKLKEDYSQYFPYKSSPCPDCGNGYFQPYTDSPTDREEVGEHVYLQTVYEAKKYLYITTPYLIIDGKMSDALTLAAKSGVDVKIITPHKWDKKFVHVVTRSYYKELLEGGVKIYEYSSGFIHSKTFVSDDRTAIVGTTNLDYRSLYLHFECGVAGYDEAFAGAVKKDFEETLIKTQEITLADCKENVFKRIFTAFLRLFAPLL